MEAKFRIDADVNQLIDARQFVEETAARFQVLPEAISKLVLAVDELTTNIIVHGYQGQAGSIEIELQSIGPDLQIRLIDHAPLFDPTTVPDPDTTLPLDERPLGGMGIYLARKIMDEMIYRSSERGNELTLIKRALIRAK